MIYRIVIGQQKANLRPSGTKVQKANAKKRSDPATGRELPSSVYFRPPEPAVEVVRSASVDSNSTNATTAMTVRSDGTPKRHYVCGIVSHSTKCISPGHPAIFTKVSYYLDWIMKTMKDTTYEEDAKVGECLT